MGLTEYLFKVCVVGEMGVGKTALIQRRCHGIFSNDFKSTIGVDFALLTEERPSENSIIRCQLWDIAGQERFGTMTKIYYKEAVGAFVVFDATNRATLKQVPRWKLDIENKVVLSNGEPVPVVLLANKVDLLDNQDILGELDTFCEEHGFVDWFSTSAKDGTGVKEGFDFLISKMLDNDAKLPKRQTSGIIRAGQSSKKADTGCCG